MERLTAHVLPLGLSSVLPLLFQNRRSQNFAKHIFSKYTIYLSTFLFFTLICKIIHIMGEDKKHPQRKYKFSSHVLALYLLTNFV